MISEVDIRDWRDMKETDSTYVHGQVFPSPMQITKDLEQRTGAAAGASVLGYQIPPTALKLTVRTSVLNEANNIVNGARNQAYGSAEDNFKNIADLWTAYKNVKFTAVDVALMMNLMKVARLKHSPNHRDSWVDMAGYAACGAECGLK